MMFLKRANLARFLLTTKHFARALAFCKTLKTNQLQALKMCLLIFPHKMPHIFQN